MQKWMDTVEAYLKSTKNSGHFSVDLWRNNLRYPICMQRFVLPDNQLRLRCNRALIKHLLSSKRSRERIKGKQSNDLVALFKSQICIREK